MKKLIILIALGVGVGGLWYWGSTRRSLLEDEGKLAKAWLDKVMLPISASGEARERQRVEIKAEASGTIIEIPVSEGEIVEPDQLLLRIDEEEEARNVDKAQAAVDQATEALGIAGLLHEQAVEDQTFNVEQAELAREAAEARFKFAESEHDRFKALAGDGNSSNTELMRKQTEHLTFRSDFRQADLALRRAKDTGPRNVKRTAAEIEAAKARLRSTQHNLSDAERRRRKTEVRNEYPSACRVVRIFVSEGQVVSSAVSVVGAGTLLMELADISVMEVEAQVDESDVDQVVRMITDGQKQRASDTPTTAPAGEDVPRYRDEVQVRFDALSRAVFRGLIIDIAQKPRTMAQIITYDVRIRLYDEPALESVRLGMQGTVEFSPISEEGLCVPHEAVKRKGRDHYVINMPDPDDPFGEPLERPVEVGLTDGRKVIIREGLEEGELVYVKLPTRIPKKKD